MGKILYLQKKKTKNFISKQHYIHFIVCCKDRTIFATQKKTSSIEKKHYRKTRTLHAIFKIKKCQVQLKFHLQLYYNDDYI